MSAVTKKRDWCQEVAVSGGSTVLVLTTNRSHCFPIVIELTLAKSMKSNMYGEKTKLWSIHSPEGNGCLLSPVKEYPRRERVIGARKLLCFSAQSEARTAATVWNWSGKTLSPGALLAVLYFTSCHIFPPV